MIVFTNKNFFSLRPEEVTNKIILPTYAYKNEYVKAAFKISNFNDNNQDRSKRRVFGSKLEFSTHIKEEYNLGNKTAKLKEILPQTCTWSEVKDITKEGIRLYGYNWICDNLNETIKIIDTSIYAIYSIYKAKIEAEYSFNRLKGQSFPDHDFNQDIMPEPF